MIAKTNRLNIDGKYNIALQDISGSTITINSGLSPELMYLFEQIDSWITNQNEIKSLNIIVIASTKSRLSEVFKSENIRVDIPYQRYSNEPSDWQPFNNQENILDILTQYQNLGYKLRALFIDSIKIDDETKNNLTLDSEKFILIADGLSFYIPENSTFASAFDHPASGGCLLPICETYKPELKELILQKIKSTLKVCYHSYFHRFDSCIEHIDIGISNKSILFRKLSNLAITKFGIKPISNLGKRYSYLANTKTTNQI